MKVPLLFDIFSPLTVRKPWMWTRVGRLKPATLQHRRPKQRVEIGDVFADEVVDFRLRAPPPIVEPLAVPLAPLQRSSPCSRSGRRTRRTNTVPARRESRNRSRAPAARRPSRAAARRGSGRAGSWRFPAEDAPLRVHSSRNPCSFSMLTNKWSALRISGFVPDSVLTGSTSSVGL